MSTNDWVTAFVCLTALPACSSDALSSSPPSTRDTQARAALDRAIVFRSEGADGRGELRLMAADGSGLRVLTHDGDCSVPAWSPDGNSIAFRNNADGLSADVGVLTVGDATAVAITEGENPRSLSMPVHWLPGGRELAYASWPEVEALYVWAISRTGGDKQRVLPELSQNQESVIWDPRDPSRFVFTEFWRDRTLDLWLVSASAEPVNLTHGRVYAPRFPRWSADGTRIAFSGYALAEDGSLEGLAAHHGGGTPPDGEIFVIDVETQALTRVTDDAWDDQTPAWAPDGEHLLIASTRDGDTDLWLISLTEPEQGQDLIDDADAPREDVMPDWYARGE